MELNIVEILFGVRVLVALGLIIVCMQLALLLKEA